MVNVRLVQAGVESAISGVTISVSKSVVKFMPSAEYERLTFVERDALFKNQFVYVMKTTDKVDPVVFRSRRVIAHPAIPKSVEVGWAPKIIFKLPASKA